MYFSYKANRGWLEFHSSIPNSSGGERAPDVQGVASWVCGSKCPRGTVNRAGGRVYVTTTSVSQMGR